MSRNVIGVRRDSLLIINQLFEEYKCEHSTLTLYHTISILILSLRYILRKLTWWAWS
jgi:hypothetical protein